jgi:hypothetical protein
VPTQLAEPARTLQLGGVDVDQGGHAGRGVTPPGQ